MDTFINKNLKLLDQRKEESTQFLKLDRNRFKQYYEIIEGYVKIKDMIIRSENVYEKTKDDYNNFSDPVVIYTNNVVQNSFELANLLAKSNPLTSLHTQVPYRLIQIKIEGRPIAYMNKHLLIRKDACSNLCQYYKFIHKHDISYMPPEYYMIQTYAEWYQQPITPDIINKNKYIAGNILKNMEHYIQQIEGKKSLSDDKPADLPTKPDKKYTTHFSDALKKFKCIRYRNTIPIGIIANESQRRDLLLYLQKHLPTHNFKYNQSFIQDNYDIRIRSYFLNMDDNVLCKVYNISEYEIIPYKIEDNRIFAHPYVVNRLLLIDFISMYYLATSVDSSALLVTLSLGLFNAIISSFKTSIDDDLSLYNKYSGSYSDKNIDKTIYKIKSVVKDVKIMNMYVPMQVKNKTGSFKELDKDSKTCNNTR